MLAAVRLAWHCFIKTECVSEARVLKTQYLKRKRYTKVYLPLFILLSLQDHSFMDFSSYQIPQLRQILGMRESRRS